MMFSFMGKHALMLTSSGLYARGLAGHTVYAVVSCELWCPAQLLHLIGQQLVIIFCVWSKGIGD